ncbi:hypothetical protein AAHA92_15680 [Salvia divinorum]|uniref:Uncharacterized protein n=1 Tax=Salvia divinorum TaxID=28513 RepID=A0ABD1HFH2_SALDI
MKTFHIKRADCSPSAPKLIRSPSDSQFSRGTSKEVEVSPLLLFFQNSQKGCRTETTATAEAENWRGDFDAGGTAHNRSTANDGGES